VAFEWADHVHRKFSCRKRIDIDAPLKDGMAISTAAASTLSRANRWRTLV